MDVTSVLKKGLLAEPKYLPMWYIYDKQGSLLYDKSCVDHPYYYFQKSEMNILTKYIKHIVDIVPKPYTLVEMGSGNSEKFRMFADTILKKQETLTYIPVDISADFLQETCDALTKEYGNKLEVKPIAGDYNTGIESLQDNPGNKLILWLDSLQNLPYKDQVDKMDKLARSMKDTDRLLISLDITQDASLVEKAYLDLTGFDVPYYLNAIWRLNREYGSSIDTDKFELTSTFVKGTAPDIPSNVLIRARSKCYQEYDIRGLGISVKFQEGEFLKLFEGEGTSCKYTIEQIETLAETGHQHLDDVWVDDDNHVAMCCFRKKHITLPDTLL